MSDQQLPAESKKEGAVTAAEDAWRPFRWLPCELSLQVPLARFTVRELLRLHGGTVVTTAWACTAEVPLYANGQIIGWTEFDAVNEHIGARITELV